MQTDTNLAIHLIVHQVAEELGLHYDTARRHRQPPGRRRPRTKKGRADLGPAKTHELSQQALTDMARVLTSDTVPGQEKRDLVGNIISRVVCQPDGADVFFLPGLGAAQMRASLDGSETCNSTLTELMQ